MCRSIVVMGIPLLQLQMHATYDDDGQAMCIISQVQISVLCGSDLVCKELRMGAMLGYWQKINSSSK